MVAAGRGQETAIALVADEALVALLQLPLERGQDRGQGGGVLLHLVAITADDVPPPGQRHGLGLVVDVLLPLGQNERDEGRGIVEDEFVHELVRALTNPKDVEKPARLQFGNRFGADHAAIGGDANPADGKALGPRGSGCRHRRCSPATSRCTPSAVAIEQHRQDHLVEVRPMVFGKAAAGAFEIEAGRAPERSSRSSWPPSRKSSTRPRVAITCWRTDAPSRRLSTI